MNNLKLFMLMLGCKPPGRYTEQHDILFTIAPDFASTETDAKAFWREADKIHIDAWREVKLVDGFRVTVVPRLDFKDPNEGKLFFLNLGGYKKDVFDEFHYKMLVVAQDKSEAIAKAKKTAFFQHTGFDGAPSHVDDKYGVDVDDVYPIEDILPLYLKEDYAIHISEILFEEPDVNEDKINLGYQRYEKISK